MASDSFEHDELRLEVLTGNALPGISDVGDDTTATWILPIIGSKAAQWQQEDWRSTSTLTVHGWFYGFGSTQRGVHLHSGPHASVTERCALCRWFELRIFFDTQLDLYVLHFAGRSAVPGETQRFRYSTAVTAFEVIEILTSDAGRGIVGQAADDSRGPVLTVPAARALAQAAGFDEDIKEAYTLRRERV